MLMGRVAVYGGVMVGVRLRVSVDRLHIQHLGGMNRSFSVVVRDRKILFEHDLPRHLPLERYKVWLGLGLGLAHLVQSGSEADAA